MAFVWLFVTMFIAGTGVPGSMILSSKLGLTEPFSVVAFGRRWNFTAWHPFTKRTLHTIYPASPFAGITGSRAIATTAVVTVLCAQIVLTEPRPFSANPRAIIPSQAHATGKFAGPHA